jgi:predicted Zn-dependent peptidase
MSQISLCDLCREIITPSDKKFLFAYYAITEEDEETKKERFKEILDALYTGKKFEDKSIKVVEICNACAGVFAHFMGLRKKELIKSRRTVKRMLTRKIRAEKIKEIKKAKGKK